MKRVYAFVLLVVLLVIGCEPELPEAPDFSSEITVTTGVVSTITYRSANVTGTLSDTYGQQISDYGHCWDEQNNPTTEDTKSSNGSRSIKDSLSFISQLSNLQLSTLYYVRAYFVIGEATVYGNQVSFTTGDGTSVLQTAPVTNITATSATSGGTIIDDGGSAITARGVCWNTTGSPTVSDSKTSDGTDTGSFVSQLSNLQLSTLYYVRSYSTNAVGTSYGDEVTFTTKDGIAELTTASITNITTSSATTGGTIIDDGGSAITARGVCWNTTGSPTVSDSKTSDGSGSGSFVSQLSNLQLSTLYYVRSYATNSFGTGYGQEVSFTTLSENDVVNPTTGKIWMDRNLGASQVATSSTDANAYGDLYQWGRAADGHEKRNSGTTSTLSSSNTPGHGNFILAPNSPYDWRSPQNDKLWQGVNGTNNPCPNGYRLPTVAEWEAERQSWSSNNAAGAYASPLKLPLAGYRGSSNGSLFNVGSRGFYWSSTVDGIYSRNLYFHSSDAYVYSNYRAYGYSVRCLKD